MAPRFTVGRLVWCMAGMSPLVQAPFLARISKVLPRRVYDVTYLGGTPRPPVWLVDLDGITCRIYGGELIPLTPLEELAYYADESNKSRR